MLIDSAEFLCFVDFACCEIKGVPFLTESEASACSCIFQTCGAFDHTRAAHQHLYQIRSTSTTFSIHNILSADNSYNIRQGQTTCMHLMIQNLVMIVILFDFMKTSGL